MKINLTPEQYTDACNMAVAHRRHCATSAMTFRRCDCPAAYEVVKQDWVATKELYKALTSQFGEERCLNDN